MQPHSTRPGPRFRPRRKLGRRDAVVNVLRTVAILSGEEATVERLSLEVGVCRRTIYNYLAAIQIAGGVLRHERGGPWRLDMWTT